MTNTDSQRYYRALGLSKADNPDEDQIKRAYKKAALKYHPDRNRGAKKEVAEKKFREINAAYEILSDPEKKKLYDMYGEDVAEGRAGTVPQGGGMGGMPAGFSFGGMPGGQSFHFSSTGGGGHQFRDPNDVFASVFGGAGGAGGLEALFAGLGGMNGINSGMGGMDGSIHNAHNSKNRGVSKQTLELGLDELANGCTKKLKVTATDVYGQPTSEVLEIKVKPGWKPGTKITFSLKSGGKVQFTIAQKPHKYLERDGNDLKWKCQLSSKQVTKGVKLTLNTPMKGENVKLCTVGKNIRHGSELTVTGKGMPIKGDLNNRGDLIVEFSVASAA